MPALSWIEMVHWSVAVLHYSCVLKSCDASFSHRYVALVSRRLMPHSHIKMHSNHGNLTWEELLEEFGSFYESSSLLNIFVGFIYKKDEKQYLQTSLLNKGLSELLTGTEIQSFDFEHKGFTPNLVVVWSCCWHTVQAQLDEWYQTVMCYNNTGPQEGVLQLLKHLQSPEENHLKKSYLKGFNAQMCNHYIKYLSLYFLCHFSVGSNAKCFFVQ